MNQDARVGVVVGSGAREHTFVEAMAASEKYDEVVCIPGNAGIAQIARCIPHDLAKTNDLAKCIAELTPRMVVIGPEQPLCDGLSDALRQKRIPVFGPSKAAAQIEGSKSWADDIMCQANVPKPASLVTSDFQVAAEYIRRTPDALVIKADGLCAGKGVIVAEDMGEALTAAEDMLIFGLHGAAGSKIVVQQKLIGHECSIMAFCDGLNAVLFRVARDNKRRRNGDQGPNTGGMGAFSPVSDVDDAMLEHIRQTIFLPVLQTMFDLGCPFRGILYAGLMITNDGQIFVLEFNCRGGDPETQVLVPHMQGDIGDWLSHCAISQLPPRLTKTGRVPMKDGAAVCVVMCADTYPKSGSKGKVISGLSRVARMAHLRIYHAGTALNADGQIVTNGGRVLSVTATGASVAIARAQAYEAVSQISWEGADYRTDIAAGV